MHLHRQLHELVQTNRLVVRHCPLEVLRVVQDQLIVLILVLLEKACEVDAEVLNREVALLERAKLLLVKSPPHPSEYSPPPNRIQRRDGGVAVDVASRVLLALHRRERLDFLQVLLVLALVEQEHGEVLVVLMSPPDSYCGEEGQLHIHIGLVHIQTQLLYNNVFNSFLHCDIIS